MAFESILKKENLMQTSYATVLDKVVLALSEFFATAILLFVACMGCVPGLRSNEALLHHSALTSGLAVMITIFLFGHISGAHVNPLTTISALIVGQIPLVLVPIYFLGQIAGAVVGYGLLKYATPTIYMSFENPTHGICTTVPSAELTSFQALVVEVFLSLILTFANCSSWDYRNKNNSDSVALKFGFLIAALIMAGGPYTGASMNPIKSFAPALWNNDWEKHWIYWVGPILAAFAGSICYRIVFLKNKLYIQESEDIKLSVHS